MRKKTLTKIGESKTEANFFQQNETHFRYTDFENDKHQKKEKKRR